MGEREWGVVRWVCGGEGVGSSEARVCGGEGLDEGKRVLLGDLLFTTFSASAQYLCPGSKVLGVH